MQITYQNTFEHWAATQICHLEHHSSLKKDDNIKFIRFIIFLLILSAFVFLAEGPDTFFKVIIVLTVFWVLHHFLLRRNMVRKLVYQRLKIAYGQWFDEENDKTIQWEISPEQIIIRNANKEYQLGLDSIQKITVCPQLFLIDFSLDDIFALPAHAFCQADYLAFCNYLVGMYQAHTQQKGKEAIVIQSDWTIDVSSLCAKNGLRFSAKKVFFSFSWAIGFIFAGAVFFGAVFLAAMIFQVVTALLPYDDDTMATLFAHGIMLGASASGILGFVLGLFGKLPGTK